MKKCTLYLAAVCLSLTFIPAQSNAAAANTATVAAVYSDSSERINAMMTRLNELKTINKENLTTSDRKALKKELRSMQKEMKRAGGGLYISVGAAIIILLLLILIL